MVEFIYAWMTLVPRWYEMLGIPLIYLVIRVWRTGRIQRLFNSRAIVTTLRIRGDDPEIVGDLLMLLGITIIYSLLRAAHQVGMI